MASIVRSLPRPPRICRIGMFTSRTSALPRFRLAILSCSRISHPRSLQTSSVTHSTSTATATGPKTEFAVPQESAGVGGRMYYGPLAQTFRRLKIFSVSSLALTCVMTPLLFLIETASAVPLLGRIALAGTVLGTSGISTALVAWSGEPYVHTLRWLPGNSTTTEAAGKQASGIELATYTLRLHERITRVYDTAFLVPTTRPFAKWELATESKLPPQEAEAERLKGALPREETIAEVFDGYGNVIGRWIVKWAEDGSGICYQQGKVLRYFNVHEELLDRPIR